MTEEQFNEWLETQPIEDKLVYLKYKYAHEDEWTFSNEILEVDMSVDGYYVWLDDWDEGQQYVEILGCIAISDIDVPVFTQADTPQADCGDFADRLAYERGVKHAWEVAQKVFNSTVTFYEAEDVAKQMTDCSKCETYWNCQGQCDEIPQIEDDTPQTEQTDCPWR